MDELLERLDFWKYGPKFLKLPKSEWPKQPSPAEKSLDENKDLKEDSQDKEEVELYFAQLKAIKFESANAKAMTIKESTYEDELGLGKLLQRCSSLQTIR